MFLKKKPKMRSEKSASSNTVFSPQLKAARSHLNDSLPPEQASF